MLTISRKAGQQVRFIWGGKDILIDVVAVAGHRVRLEVKAPDDVAVEMLDAQPRPDPKTPRPTPAQTQPKTAPSPPAADSPPPAPL